MAEPFVKVARAAWSNAGMFARRRRIFVLHCLARVIGVQFKINGIPFGADLDDFELLQRGPTGDFEGDIGAEEGERHG